MLIRRVIVTFLVLVTAAFVNVPAGHAAGPVTGVCEFLGGSPLTLVEGGRPRARITFLNSSGASARFTATVQAGFHYWHATPFYGQLLAAETGLVQAEVDLPPAYGVGLGQESDLQIKITSSQTGDASVGGCSTRLKLTRAPDADGDGLLDTWESHGIDYDQDGTVDLALNQAPYSADPNRKDVFVELDAMFCAASYCLRSRELDPAAISQTVAAFAAHGITLHVRTGERVFEAERITFDVKSSGTYDDFDDIRTGDPDLPCDGGFGDVLDRVSPNCENILGAKRLVFRYGLSAHGLTGRGTQSGQAEVGDDSNATVSRAYSRNEALPGGNDFVVTLGAWSTQLINDNGGQVAAEAGTFMHELGHTLGLQHGGEDSINCKPHYLSVMNYTYQFPTASTATRPLDYQPVPRTTLREDGLDETLPAVPGAGATTVVYGQGGGWRTTPANVAVNWNGNTTVGTEAADITNIALGTDVTSCPPSPGQVLNAWDDWAHLNLNFRESLWFEDGAHRGVLGLGGTEITAEAAASLNPPIDLTAAKTVDRREAAPGDTLAYTVEVGNKGPATATAVTIDDTMPDGTTVRRTTPDVAGGGSAREPFTYAIPCTTTDGTVLTNKASVAGKNERGYAESGTLADNTASVSTTVRRPVIALEASAPPAVNAGEAAAYTLTYRNDGSAPASAAAVTATLPAGLYYSTALDQGAGPRPDTVTRNADGTTALRWNTGTLPAHSGAQVIAFTARPSLLSPEGATVTVPVSLGVTATGSCPIGPVAASAETRITVVAATRDPKPVAHWSLRPDLRTPEALARTQATDQRFDGVDGTAPDGVLAQQEATATFLLPLLQPRTLRAELLAAGLNLATRRINAGTAIRETRGLRTVGEAVRHAQETLTLPVSANLLRYTQDTLLLAEINSGPAISG